MDAVPSGSYLAILHGASDVGAENMPEAERRYNEQASAQFNARDRQQVSRFLDGLELIGPGLVNLSRWGQSAGATTARRLMSPPSAGSPERRNPHGRVDDRRRGRGSPHVSDFTVGRPDHPCTGNSTHDPCANNVVLVDRAPARVLGVKAIAAVVVDEGGA
jgi:hypothetical protein